MNPIAEQILSFLQLYIKLFNELVLTPILNIIQHQPKEDDEMTIKINIDTTRPRTSPRVKFGELEIRTYESILGDNPSCSRGPPLAIGWKVSTTKTTSVDTFENHPSRKDMPRVDEFEMIMDKTEREQALLRLGYTKSEIAAATRQTIRDKKKRRQTADNLSACYVEEKVEGFKKSVRRRFLMKKGTKAMYKDWKKADSQLQRETASDDDDLWHRTKSVLVLSRGDSGSTSTTEEVVDGAMMNIPKNIKISSRKGRSRCGFPAHRRASL